MTEARGLELFQEAHHSWCPSPEWKSDEGKGKLETQTKQLVQFSTYFQITATLTLCIIIIS